MIRSPSREEHAVFFFDGKKLIRQLLWLEFEAVLDGFVPLQEQAGQRVQAVYLTLVPGPMVEASVFFLVDFDKNGFADKRWNIPLDQLSENSPTGPDLGAGPIRLACRSQCTISWYQDQLWDPDLQSDDGHLVTIKQAVAANRLNLRLEEVVESAESLSSNVVSLNGDQGTQRDMDARESQLMLATFQERHRQELEQLKRRHSEELEARDASLNEERQKSISQQQKIDRLEADASGLRQKISGLRDYFEHKCDQIKSVDEATLEALARQHEADREEAVQEAVSLLQDKLQIRDIELMYRDTQVSSLQEEVERLHVEKQDLLDNSGNKLLGRLHSQGISFVTFQPGAGQITVPLNCLNDFLEDRLAFVAERCGVDKNTYRQWLEHYREPVCNSVIEGGRLCGQGVDRINHPSDYSVGHSDRCLQHRICNRTLPEAAST